MKRFEWDNVNIAITDTQNKKNYWIDITCIDELIDLLNTFNEENEQLKAQLHCDDSVCKICKYSYLVETEQYFIAKCKKGHEQCSKVDVNYCDDFELKGDVE